VPCPARSTRYDRTASGRRRTFGGTGHYTRVRGRETVREAHVELDIDLAVEIRTLDVGLVQFEIVCCRYGEDTA
jgi:hypothetical protein